MTRRRFYAPTTAFSAESIALDTDESRHLRDVLRLKYDAEVHVFDGAGKEYRCRVAQITRDLVHLQIIEEVEAARPESGLRLTLSVALLKGDKFDLVVQKGTELGVTEFVPLVTRYADIQLRDEADGRKRVARWQRIALEAAKQSGRALVPQIAQPVKFAEVVNGTNEDGLHLMFSERGGNALNKDPSVSGVITALVGSEGGWADEEIELARTSGWEIVTLGGRIMRAETAGIAVAVLLQHLFGDLN
jgi:16S rRNA (uracil1498-N3)-methyltransferase